MPAIDEELWANLYRFSYSEPNRTTSLSAKHPPCLLLLGGVVNLDQRMYQ